MNETKKAKVHVSICPSGSQLFWCVVDADTEDVIAYGREPTLEEAEEQIWAQAAIFRKGHKAIQLDEAFAKRIRRELWKSDCQPIGKFLYEYIVTSLDAPLTYVSHPIIKLTKRFVYVKHRRCVFRVKLDQLQRSRRGFASDDLVFHTLPPDELWAAQKVDRRLWKNEAKRLKRIGLSAFSEDERQEALDYLQKHTMAVTDERLLVLCVAFHNYEVVHELGT